MSDTFGFVQIDRAEIAALIHDASTLQVWMQLQAWKAFQDHKKRFGGAWQAVKVGEVYTTQRALAAATGLTREVIRQRLAKLVAKGWISVATTREMSVITIKGLAAVPVHPSSEIIEKKATQQDPPTFPQAIPTPDTRVPLDPQRPREISRRPPPTRKPTRLPRNNNGKSHITLETTEITHPTSCGARRLVGGGTKNFSPPLPGDDRLDVVDYAQRALRRVVSGREAAAFLDQWAAMPWLTAPEIRGTIDFLAADPRRTAETGSIVRAFYGAQVRAAYARIDRSIRLARPEPRDLGSEARILPL